MMMREWATQPPEAWYPSLQALRDSAYDEHNRSRRFRGEVKALQFGHDGTNVTLVRPDKGLLDGAKLNHHAFGQICYHLDAPAGALRERSPGLVVDYLNECAKDVKPGVQTKLLATRELDQSVSIKAATGPDYGVIPNYRVAELAQYFNTLAPGFKSPPCWDGRAGGMWLSNRRIVICQIDGGSLVDGGGERDEMYRGYYMWNSEVGDCKFYIDVFLFRVICGNLQIWGKTSEFQANNVHRKNAARRFEDEGISSLRKYLQSGTHTQLEWIRNAKNMILPAKEPEVIEIGFKRGIPKQTMVKAIALANEEEGKCENMWELVQGGTAFARDLPYADDRIALSTQFGKLMELAQ